MDASLGDIASRGWRRPITPSARRTGRSSRPPPPRRFPNRSPTNFARPSSITWRNIRIISRGRTRGRKLPNANSIRCPASFWFRGWDCSGWGIAPKKLRIAADIAESTVQTITDAEAIGRFQSLPENDLFDMEYWLLEQAKLEKRSQAAGGSGRGHHRRRRDDRDGGGKTFRRLRRGNRSARSGRVRGTGGGAADRGGGHGRPLRRDRCGLRGGGVRGGHGGGSAVWISSFPTRG